MSVTPAAAVWRTVALSEELVPGAPLGVICDGVRYALFRDNGGVVRAVHDECAHRRAPLSLGHVTADGLVECPYHGWRYDGSTGACVQIPNLSASERVPRAYRVRAFAVSERDGFIHLWPAGQDGDERLLPALSIDSGDKPWNGSTLIAFPTEQLVDLLLDAPSAVLSIGSVTIADGHPYGDPVVEADHVVVEYAASWAMHGRGPKRAIADYPLALRIAVRADGAVARIDLRTDVGEPVASARMAFSPVGPSVSRLLWRGTAAERAGKPVDVGVVNYIRPQAMLAAYPYASVVRHQLYAAKPALRA